MSAYLGIDAGSTYTKYCVMNRNAEMLELTNCRTRVMGGEPDNMLISLREKYAYVNAVSCGYGRNNFEAGKTVSELIALAKGLHYADPSIQAALDIGGQDTKVILMNNGKLKQFYMNDKCAAGSGLFLLNTLRMLDMDLCDVKLSPRGDFPILSSTCAVFAQTEIVGLIAEGISKDSIVNSVVYSILKQAVSLLDKADARLMGELTALTGGFTNVADILEMFSDKFGANLIIPQNGAYLSAIGCALCALE